jgi:SAM-dependent methyltransferase
MTAVGPAARTPSEEPRLGALPEPYRAEFVRLINLGAAATDVLGTPSYEGASPAFIERELARPREHLRNICKYIRHLQPSTILDMGCGTGGLTVALCAAFPSAQVFGVDAIPLTVEAARVRTAGYGLNVPFVVVPGDVSLPFPADSFDLVTCTSVIEFVTDRNQRRRFARELARVARQYIVVTTPNPLPRLREQHTGRWLGDFRRAQHFPWASTPRELDKLFAPFLRTRAPQRVLDKLRVPSLPAPLSNVVEMTMPWQFAIYQAPEAPTRT